MQIEPITKVDIRTKRIEIKKWLTKKYLNSISIKIAKVDDRFTKRRRLHNYNRITNLLIINLPKLFKTINLIKTTQSKDPPNVNFITVFSLSYI